MLEIRELWTYRNLMSLEDTSVYLQETDGIGSNKTVKTKNVLDK